MSAADIIDMLPLKGDTEAAVDFLLRWHAGEDRVVLITIHPETNKTERHDFKPAETVRMRRVIGAAQGRLNSYTVVNVAGPGKTTPTKDEMLAARAFHVDADFNDMGCDGDQALARLRSFDPPPSVIIFSGGGFWPLWLLDQHHADGDDWRGWIETICGRLHKAVGAAPACRNVNRLMRLPGTVNVLNKTKRAAGRIPALAYVVSADWNRRWSFNDPVPKLPESGIPGAISVPDEIQNAISTSNAKKYGGGQAGPALAARSNGHDNSRSGAAFRLALVMHRSGGRYEEFCEAARSNGETAAWCREKGEASGGRELKRAWENAGDIAEKGGGASLDDFYAYMPQHNYIYVPLRVTWPAASVNALIPPIPVVDETGAPALDDKGKPMRVPASTWLDRNKHVEQMTWAPGLPMTIADRLLLPEGGWVDHPGATGFNLYHPPTIVPGDPARATPWLDLVRYVYTEDADRILDWFAHRAQRPQDKINHALVLGGDPGIGKDTIIEPVKHAVGPWNFQEVSPPQLLGRFNEYLKSVIMRVSEVRDLGEFTRFEFYDHMKAYTAAPPDVLRVDGKHLREQAVINCCGIIYTTNHKTDGIYLPPNDRRHYVAWSNRKQEDGEFQGGYWDRIWDYYATGGLGHVTAYLLERDLSGFNAKAPPPKTTAFWEIANAGRSTEEAEMADVLDELGNPDAVTLEQVRFQVPEFSAFRIWLDDRKNRRAIPHRFEECGYVAIGNDDAKDKLWKIAGRRCAVYTRSSLSRRDQIAAAIALKAKIEEGAPKDDYGMDQGIGLF